VVSLTGYEDDLAYIHHAGFTRLAEQAAVRIVELLRERGIRSGLVVELGCGSGVTARALTEAGYDVLGIDSSPAMVRLAGRIAPRASFEVGSFVDESLPPCAAATSVGEVLGYLFDEANDARALDRLFRRVRDALAPGGVFVFDLAGPGRVPPGEVERGHAADEDWAVLFEAEEDPRRRLLTRRMTTFRRVGKHYRRGQEVHRVRLIPAAEAAARLRRAGFSARILRGYAGERFAPGHAVLVGRKRA
jgi:SAM-dependent methyltransferase